MLKFTYTSESYLGRSKTYTFNTMPLCAALVAYLLAASFTDLSFWQTVGVIVLAMCFASDR